MESGDQKGVLSWPTTPSQLQTKQEERYLGFSIGRAYILLSWQGKKYFLLEHNSPVNEKLSQLSQSEITALWTPSFFQWAFVSNSPSKYLYFSTEEYFFPLFCGLAYGFAIACLSQIAVFCYSKINSFFAGTIIDSFIFKVITHTSFCFLILINSSPSDSGRGWRSDIYKSWRKSFWELMNSPHMNVFSRSALANSNTWKK